MASNGTQAQLERIAGSLQSIESSLASGRLFDVLEIIRDQVYDLKEQNRQVRNAIFDVQRAVLTQPD